MSMILSSNSPMAPSPSSSQIKRYHVFPSFHGPDVRRGFLSHLHNLFERKGITTFKDQEIERGHTIGPELVKAIRESRISVVLLSKNYASSSWCLDELVEIFKCEQDSGQTMMTIFYDVDPSDVRKQNGDFGKAFEKTCQGKTEQVKQRWIEALQYVATIAGEHSLNSVDEATMAENFATDVSNKLNITLSRDFDNMVGLQAHLRKVNTLLCLESDEVKMIGIWGPAGIGKTTIARALYDQLSSQFPLRCFMDSYKSILGVIGNYESKLCLQNEFLSRTLNQRDMRVSHFGVIKERLHDQRVLAILNDVDDLEQLDVLANESSWFGPGSRIIVTTQDKKILQAHEIHDIYHVPFPWEEEALEILCLAAFKQCFVPDGFEEVARKVAKLCGNLPLGLRVVGSSLRGQSKHEWELQLSKIETNPDRKIVDVLRMGYDRLSKKDQSLFRHLACIFDYETKINDVTAILADSNLDVQNGLKTLASKSLVVINDGLYSPYLVLRMHSLLRQMGRQVVHEQSDEPGKRQFLVEAEEIRDVLANETGTGSIIGILLDMYIIRSSFSITGRTFKKMRNLRFFSIKGSALQLHITEDLVFLPRLRVLDWNHYPGKSLPPTFQPDCLVELCMRHSNLERLWEGIKPLPNLKKIDLSDSQNLKELPDLSNATNLETLILLGCTSLVELPSSIRNLHKLEVLEMRSCINLQVIPTNINLATLERVNMIFCSRLRSFPDISSKIKYLDLSETKIEDVPPSVAGSWLRLEELSVGSRSLKRLTHVPEGVRYLDLSNSDIKRLPDCIIGLPFLATLIITNCRKLVSLQNLPPLLWMLDASDCGSLKSVSFSFYEPRGNMAFYDRKCLKLEKEILYDSSFNDYDKPVMFVNCFSLDEEARRVIIQRWGYKSVLLPGKEVPVEFSHKATGNSITISSGTFSPSSRFKSSLLLPLDYDSSLVCRLRSKGVLINELHPSKLFYKSRGQHLFVMSGDMFKENSCLEVDAATTEIEFEFSCEGEDKVIECGVQILEEEAEGSRSKRKEHSCGAVVVAKSKKQRVDKSKQDPFKLRHSHRRRILRKKTPPHEMFETSFQAKKSLHSRIISKEVIRRPELVKAIRSRRLGADCADDFYDVDPFDVRKQRGNYESAFEKTCEGKTEEEKQRWIEVLEYVATIGGEHSIKWFVVTSFELNELVFF